MERQMEPCQLIERSIIKKYRKELWTPFIVAVKRYELVQAGDKIAVCISGGKDSMLMAKLMQELQRHSDVPFELVFLVMDPGYNEINRQKIESNAALLNIPITIFETDVFAVANNSDKSPCYLCARMRRGYLYKKAQELGCNKIALGHHFNDVIETTVMSMFYGSQLQAMPPKPVSYTHLQEQPDRFVCGADQCGGTADCLYGRAGLLRRMAVHPDSGRGHWTFQCIAV